MSDTVTKRAPSIFSDARPVVVIFRLHRYRRQFLEILSASSANLNRSRFLRLFLMALMLLLIFLPVQFYILAVNLSYPHRPYSWSAVHSPDWSSIIMIPTGGQVAFDRWIRVSSGFLVFLFFGTGTEAMSMYRKWLLRLGFGHCFPRLAHPRRTSGARKHGIFSSRFGFFTDRAKTFFSKGSTTTTTTTMASL